MANTAKSESLLNKAESLIPGGVNSPVRAFNGVGGKPIFISSASGAHITDVDGNQYLDYVGSWGPMILGHNSKVVRDAIATALEGGTSFGAPTEREVEIVELVKKCVPSIEMLRMVNSGTEATMTAIRLARGYTGRDYIIKFNGCYHGHADSLLVQAGSGVATCSIPGSPGIPEGTTSTTLSIEFNDIDVLQQTIDSLGADKIAAVIIEPVPGNMGLILPEPGYLESLRKITKQNGIVLIFDEVMSGFRVALGGAQERFNIEPDLTTLGKVIGGGLPVGAFGGRAEIMNCLAPKGPVYQAGTLSGNPLAMAAGQATLQALLDNNPYPQLENLAKRLSEGLLEKAKEAGVDLQSSYLGSMVGFFFSDQEVKNYSDAKNSNIERFQKFFHLMLERGFYLAPSAFEAGFIGVAHSEELIDQTVEAAGESFQALVA